MSELKIFVPDVNQVYSEIKSLSDFDFIDYAFSFKRRRIILFMKTQKVFNVDDLIYRFNQSDKFVSDFVRFLFVPQTELFRDAELWNYLNEKIFPKLLLKKDVNIHIPCCTGGEEVYSLMFFLGLFQSSGVTITVSYPLSENENFIKNRKFNQQDLKKCVKNIELLNNVLNPEDVFIGQTNQMRINHFYRGNVNFKKEKIMNQQYISEFDLVLFRNRLIYFNEDLQSTVLPKINASIKKGGYLILGEKEILGQMSGKFKKITSKLSVYKKRIF
ncbi:MAG: hypothetical protein L3J56_01075 [Bacteroidales bacterium]|nr:hypothetical protein [Bacteroidales bacterium]